MNGLRATLAAAGLLAATQASAFWGWDDNDSYSSGSADSRGDFVGDADAEGEASFTFNFTGRMKARGNARGETDSAGDWSGYSYDSPYWYGAPYYYGVPYWGPYAPPASPVSPPPASR